MGVLLVASWRFKPVFPNCMYSSAGFTGLDCTADIVTWQRLLDLGLSSAEIWDGNRSPQNVVCGLELSFEQTDFSSIFNA